MLNDKQATQAEQTDEQIVDEMREIVNTPIEPVEEESQEATAPIKYSEAELNAMAKGWKPQDKFGDPNKKYLTAEEFLDRGELYESLSHQKKENKKLQESIKEILELNKRQAELALRDRANYFNQQRNAAIEIGNKADFEKYDSEYNESKKALDEISIKPAQQAKQEQETPRKPIHPAVEEFVKRNISWFNDSTDENRQMRDFVIKKEEYIRATHPDWSDERCILESERSVKDLFPHRFENVNRTRKPSVNISSPESVSVNQTSKKATFNQLPRDVQAAIRPWAERCGMGLDEYAEQLIREGVIKNVR
jgi:hypothetical protein